MSVFHLSIFVIAIFEIHQCVGLENEYPHIQYKTLIGGEVVSHLSEYWWEHAKKVEDVIEDVFEHKIAHSAAEKIRKNLEVKLTRAEKVDEWMRDIWAIVVYNKHIASAVTAIETSKFQDAQVNYMEMSKKLNNEIIQDLRNIVSFASQPKLTLKESSILIHGTQPNSEGDFNHSILYNGVLRKYEARLTALDIDESKKLKNLTAGVKSKMNAIFKQIYKIGASYHSVWETFTLATEEIESVMSKIAEGKNSGEMEKMKTYIEECKDEMKKPALKKVLNTTVQKINKLMDEIDAAQKDLPHDIEEILKSDSIQIK